MNEQEAENELIMSINNKKNSVGIFSQPGELNVGSEIEGYGSEYDRDNRQPELVIDDLATGNGIFNGSNSNAMLPPSS